MRRRVGTRGNLDHALDRDRQTVGAALVEALSGDAHRGGDAHGAPIVRDEAGFGRGLVVDAREADHLAAEEGGLSGQLFGSHRYALGAAADEQALEAAEQPAAPARRLAMLRGVRPQSLQRGQLLGQGRLVGDREFGRQTILRTGLRSESADSDCHQRQSERNR